MHRGFLYLVALVDVFSRRVMAWRLSNTLTVDFCVAALEEALGRYGPPEIFNTDQGSQFTRQAFIEVLEQAKVRISPEPVEGIAGDAGWTMYSLSGCDAA
jgi:putative transposase